MLGEEKSERKSLTPQERMDLIFRQNLKCFICLETLSRTFEVDHIIPLQYNGQNEVENLQALCPRCHIFKSSSIDRNMPAIVAHFKKRGIMLTKYNLAKEIRVRFLTRNRILPPHQNPDMMLFNQRLKNLFEKSCQEQIRCLTNFFVQKTTSVFEGLYRQRIGPALVPAPQLVPAPTVGEPIVIKRPVKTISPQNQMAQQNLILRKLLLQIRAMLKQKVYLSQLPLGNKYSLYIHLGDGEKTQLENSFPGQVIAFLKRVSLQKKEFPKTKLLLKDKFGDVSLGFKEK